MAVLVDMPRLSDTMREGTIERWAKKAGEAVESGDVLAEIETDKAVMEWESSEDGVLLEIFVPDGGSAPVGAPLCIIGEEGEDVSELVAEAKARADGASAEAPDEEEPARDEAAEGGASKDGASKDGAAKDGASKSQPAEASKSEPAKGDDAKAKAKDAEAKDSKGKASKAQADDDGAHRISPLAARIAADRGVDLSQVEGTGPGGRIVKRDVIEAQTHRGEIAPAPGHTGFAPAGSQHEDTAPSQMRRVIAERLVESKNDAPHFYLTVSLDVAPLMALRAEINRGQDRVKVSVNDLVVKAAALASRQVPAVNAAWVEGSGAAKLRHFRDVHVGVAVALDDGLVTPVLRHADRRSLTDLAVETREMVERARARRLDPAAYQGNTITVSNLGMFGVEHFTAIINPPASLILAVGAAADVPVVEDGELKVGKRMKVTLSCDHRVVDGALGARWLQAFRALVESPLNILTA